MEQCQLYVPVVWNVFAGTLMEQCPLYVSVMWNVFVGTLMEQCPLYVSVMCAVLASVLGHLHRGTCLRICKKVSCQF